MRPSPARSRPVRRSPGPSSTGGVPDAAVCPRRRSRPASCRARVWWVRRRSGPKRPGRPRRRMPCRPRAPGPPVRSCGRPRARHHEARSRPRTSHGMCHGRSAAHPENGTGPARFRRRTRCPRRRPGRPMSRDRPRAASARAGPPPVLRRPRRPRGRLPVSRPGDGPGAGGGSPGSGGGWRRRGAAGRRRRVLCHGGPMPVRRRVPHCARRPSRGRRRRSRPPRAASAAGGRGCAALPCSCAPASSCPAMSRARPSRCPARRGLVVTGHAYPYERTVIPAQPCDQDHWTQDHRRFRRTCASLYGVLPPEGESVREPVGICPEHPPTLR